MIASKHFSRKANMSQSTQCTLCFSYSDEDSKLELISDAEYDRIQPPTLKFTITPGEGTLEHVSPNNYAIYQVIADGNDIQIHYVIEEKTFKKAIATAGAIFYAINNFPPKLCNGEEMKVKSKKKLNELLRFNDKLFDEFIVIARARDKNGIVLSTNPSDNDWPDPRHLHTF